MIKSFRHKGLERFFVGGTLAGIQPKHKSKLSLQLFTLHRAKQVADMDLNGWDLHPLQGELKGLWAVQVNGNWRVTFRFEDGDATVVDYTDYH